MDVLATAGQLKNELDALRPLDAEAEARIMQKFRLDWNYHSNNLEGNSLTYGETKALILFGITAQGKPLKDHFEITGHNEALNWIIELVKDETELTEVFIRQLHQLLLKESYEVETQTQNGKSTKRRIEVGKYKTQPNHVITQTGETFYFAAPEETPAKMQELVEWFRKEKENPDTNPIVLAALFHYKFIRIHPFDDGNGRVARILMNFILMQYGFPPVIIKTNDKENYFSVLQQADAGIFEPFIEYIADNLIRSLEIMIKGAKGESIEEPEDLDKELALLESELKSTGLSIEKVKSKEILIILFKESISFLISELLNVSRKFCRFYLESNVSYSYKETNKDEVSLSYSPLQTNPQIGQGIVSSELEMITMQVFYKRFRHRDIEVTGDFQIKFVFNYLNYIIYNSENKIVFDRLYGQNITHDEINRLVKFEANKHKELIKQVLKEESKK